MSNNSRENKELKDDYTYLQGSNKTFIENKNKQTEKGVKTKKRLKNRIIGLAGLTLVGIGVTKQISYNNVNIAKYYEIDKESQDMQDTINPISLTEAEKVLNGETTISNYKEAVQPLLDMVNIEVLVAKKDVMLNDIVQKLAEAYGIAVENIQIEQIKDEETSYRKINISVGNIKKSLVPANILSIETPKVGINKLKQITINGAEVMPGEIYAQIREAEKLENIIQNVDKITVEECIEELKEISESSLGFKNLNFKIAENGKIEVIKPQIGKESKKKKEVDEER